MRVHVAVRPATLRPPLVSACCATSTIAGARALGKDADLGAGSRASALDDAYCGGHIAAQFGGERCMGRRRRLGRFPNRRSGNISSFAPPMVRLALATLVACVATVALAQPDARASAGVRFGIQDDAWLTSGPGTLESRLDTLDRLGVKIVRYALLWDQIATRRPEQPRWSGDPAYEWGAADAVLKGLRAHGIAAVLDLRFAPGWANGGKKFNYLPLNATDFGDFAAAAYNRYPWVRDWLIWNEPNKAGFAQPVSPQLYVQRLLNPAYAALHAANGSVRVAGGVTGPRAGRNGMSPVAFLRGMKSAGARLDAYAHHPYPEWPTRETPTSGGCGHCASITMATLEKLLREVQRAWPGKRIWLTEYGYQTNPPDRVLGVSPATQARYIGEAALRVYRAKRVDMLIHFLVTDDPLDAGWQSGFYTVQGKVKPGFNAFRFPLAQVSRRGGTTILWGQIRPRDGRQTYRLQVFRGGWRSLGAAGRTDTRGFFRRTVRLGKGAKVRIYSPRDRAYSPTLVVR